MRHLERPVSRLARRFFVGAIIVSASLVAAGQRAVDESLPALLPDSELRDELLFRADELPRLRSLLVSVDGQLVEEHYYHGAICCQGRLALKRLVIETMADGYRALIGFTTYLLDR